MVKKNIAFSFLFIFFILAAPVSAQWAPPPGTPTGGNPPPPVWIQTVSPGFTQLGNIHIGNKAMIDGDIQVGKSSGQVSGLMYGILNLLDIGKTIDPGLDITGRMLDINTAGNTGMVVRSSLGGGPTAVALGIGPSYIGTRTAHALQFWTDTLTRMIILETGNVGIAPTLLPAYKLDVGGDINTSSMYRAGGIAGIDLAAATCVSPKVLKGINVKGGIITAASCADDIVGGGGGGGMANPMTAVGDIIYGGASGVATRLPGSVGFLKSSGASAPVWSTLTSGDFPDLGGSYIKNQTSVQQDPGGFNIKGNGFVGNMGIGTASLFGAKLVVQHAPGSLGVVFHNGTSGLKFNNPATGPELGTYTDHPLALSTHDTRRVIVTGSTGILSGRMGIGANPKGAIDVDARLVVCRTGNLATNTLCTMPSNNPTVAVFGSSNDATTGSSVRARGVIEAQGGFRTPAGGSIQSGMSDLGEYVAVAGKAHEYEQGDVLVIGVQPNKFTKSLKPFDPKVAGIVTTTAGYIGGVTEQGLPPTSSHVVMALVGQLQAKVSTEQGIVKMGDLLTTSSTAGTLMKCPSVTIEDKLKCVGAVTAKALEPLSQSHGLIKVLLTLQ